MIKDKQKLKGGIKLEKDIKLNHNVFLSITLDESSAHTCIQMSFYDEVVGTDISLSQMEEIVRELNNIIRIKRRLL